MNSSTALILIDIQNDYFQGGANPLVGSWEASISAKKMLMLFRKEKLPIIHIQHIAIRPGSIFLINNTKGAEIHENVKPLDKEKLIIKHFPNSFRATELLDYLKSIEIKELVFCGMMTHMCVDTSVRVAKDLGFNCTLISDACATKDLEIFGQKVNANDVHNSFLAALSYFFATVITCKEYFELAY